MTPSSTHPAKLPQTRGIQFSLRSVVIAMTVLAVVAAIVGPWVRTLSVDQQLRLLKVVVFICAGIVVGVPLGFVAFPLQSKRAGELAVSLFVRSAPTIWAWVWRSVVLAAWLAFTAFLSRSAVLIDAQFSSGWMPLGVIFVQSVLFGQLCAQMGLPGRMRQMDLRSGCIIVASPLEFIQWHQLSPIDVGASQLRFRRQYSRTEYVCDVRESGVSDEDLRRVLEFFDEHKIPYVIDKK